MGFSIKSGPDWKDDSHGYINKDTTAMSVMREISMDDLEFRTELDRLTRIQTDPRVSQEEADKATAEIEKLIAERAKDG